MMPRFKYTFVFIASSARTLANRILRDCNDNYSRRYTDRANSSFYLRANSRAGIIRRLIGRQWRNEKYRQTNEQMEWKLICSWGVFPRYQKITSIKNKNYAHYKILLLECFIIKIVLCVTEYNILYSVNVLQCNRVQYICNLCALIKYLYTSILI